MSSVASPASRYRQTLREQVATLAPLALDMLGGRDPVDPLVVLEALRAASLLATWGGGDPETESQRQALLAAAPLSSSISVIGASLDMPQEEEKAREGAPEELFHRILAAAAVAPFLGREEDRVTSQVEEYFIWTLVSPEALSPFSATARFISDVLDLPGETLAGRWLEEVVACEARASLPLPVTDLSATVPKILATEKANIPISTVSWLRRRIPGARAWLEDRLALPVPARAATGPSGEVPPRYLLARHLTGAELTLSVVPGAVILEWYGEGPPPEEVRFVPSGMEFLSTPPSVEGSASWLFPLPPEGTTALEVVSGEERWTLPLPGFDE